VAKFLNKGDISLLQKIPVYSGDTKSRFLAEAYPEIDTISNKGAQMERAGYLPIATFVVPESCWTYYYEVQHPQMQESLLEKYKGNKSAEDFIAYQRYEAELYHKYKEYYGYVFYIGKRI
jgi:hypothetical protein